MPATFSRASLAFFPSNGSHVIEEIFQRLRQIMQLGRLHHGDFMTGMRHAIEQLNGGMLCRRLAGSGSQQGGTHRVNAGIDLLKLGNINKAGRVRCASPMLFPALVDFPLPPRLLTSRAKAELGASRIGVSQAGIVTNWTDRHGLFPSTH